ncbi:hypothetical protein MU582_07815 [Nocardioidaceae bacterium SCSIO 66511]|nr:hypothetical protein MU582_07815 [Nocardioidaceae bacterium SCSIO 66511]
MIMVQRLVFWSMIPMNLLCVGWVWIGRAFFGVGGWMFIVLLALVPILLLALTLTTALVFVQQLPYERGRITLGQAIAQTIVWAAMIGFGAFLVDYGDAPESDASVLTEIVGRTDSTLRVSSQASALCAVVFIGAYVWLLVLLIIGTKNRPRLAAKAGQYGPFAANPGPPPPGPPPPPWA